MNFFDNYFVFSTSEKKGIFTFVVLLFLMSLFYAVMPSLFPAKKYDFTEFKKELAAKQNKASNRNSPPELFSFNPNNISRDSLLMLGFNSKQSYNIVNFREKVGRFKSKQDFKKIYSISDSLYQVVEPFLVLSENKKHHKNSRKEFSGLDKDSLFAFDPNTASLSDFEKLGLSNKQSKTIFNYRSKGGQFRKKEDFKKMYSISDKKYNELESFIAIETKSEVEIPKLKKAIEKIEINLASKSQLIAIRGIGEKTATRILKYRKQLGGFSELSQLDKVYGLDSNLKVNKTTFFEVEPKLISKILLNEVTFKELLAHPYFDYNTTQKIINFREMHGDFESIEQILENNLIK
ncbi:MAG: helix-hairpin-helix domain-containing protein, partial [Flavobacteriales bacterium]